METNPLHRALDRRRASDPTSVIDLMNTNFLDCGYRFPADVLTARAGEYFRTRGYRPDPKGDPAARAAIGSYYRRAGIEIDEEALFVTSSTSESYSLLFSLLARPEDNVVLPVPGYPLFEQLAAMHHLEVRNYVMRYERRFAIDIDTLEQAIDRRTRAVVLISPNNPTGMVATDSEIDAVIAVCERRGVPLVCDEVFSEFLFDPFGGGAALPRPARRRAAVPVYTLNGVSKMFACPDLKVAWIAATGTVDTEALERLELENDTFLSCSPLSQFMLPELFARGGAFRRSMVDEVGESRDVLSEYLGSSERVRGHTPLGGIHAVLGVARDTAAGDAWHDDESFAVALLEQTGVHVHPGYFYGIDETNDTIFVVVSFLPKPPVLRAGLRRLSAFLASGG